MKPIDALIEKHLEKANGGLTLVDGEMQKGFVFKNGNITFIQSNLRDETLAAILVKLGRLTRDQHLQVVEQMMQTGKMQGDTLVEMGLLTPSEVFESLTLQMEEKLKSALKMGDCSASFASDTPNEIPTLQLPFFRTLLDGLVENYSSQRFKEEASFKRHALISITPEAGDYLAQAKLKPAMMRYLRSIDGKTSMGDLIANSDNKRLITAILFLLTKMRFLKYADDPKTAPQPVSIKNDSPAKEPTPSQGLNKLFDEAVEAVDHVKQQTQSTDKPAKPPAQKKQTGGYQENEEMYATLLRMRNLDFFEILSIPAAASASEVERSFNLLIKKYHLGQIEKHYSDQDQPYAKQLLDVFTMAYAVLHDNDKRAEYIAGLEQQQDREEMEKDNSLRAEVSFLKAQTYLRFNNLQEAITAAREAIQLKADDPSHHILFGQIQMKLDISKEGKPSSMAEEAFRKAIEINPNHFEPYLEMAYYYKLKDNADKARQFFNKALDRNPNCSAAERELRLIEMRTEKKGKGLFSSLRKKN